MSKNSNKNKKKYDKNEEWELPQHKKFDRKRKKNWIDEDEEDYFLDRVKRK